MTVYFRSFVAVCAAFVASVICIVERHFTVAISRPATYANPLHHKCGLLLAVCLGWVMVEGVQLLRLSRTSEVAV